MKVTRFYAGSDGESHFDEVEIPITDKVQDAAGGTILRSQEYPSPGVAFLELPAVYVGPRHNAPGLLVIAMLSGDMEVETSDGERRRWGPGEVYVANDVTGNGHITRIIEGPVRLLFAPPAEGFDVERWSM